MLTFNTYTNKLKNLSDNHFDVVNLLVYKLMYSNCQKLVLQDTKSTVKREVYKDFMATGVAVV